MKIIKQGKRPEDRIWDGTCTNCGSILQAHQHELNITHDPRDGYLGDAECPVCERRVFFYINESEAI